MTVQLVYVCAVPYPGMENYLRRFVDTYNRYPPESAHRFRVVVNGGQLNGNMRGIIKNLNLQPEVVYGDNVGWDIGAYIKAAASLDADSMFCCGSSTHFKRAGWLKRMGAAWGRLGPGYYGAMGSYERSPHIRTAAGFMVDPVLLASYPHKVVSKEDRYRFEHGSESMTWWAKKNGVTPMVVAWDREYGQSEWESIPNGFRNGNQSNSLTYDSVSDRWASHWNIK